MTGVLFHSADLLVRQVGAVEPGAPVAVTFDCYGDWHTREERPGFGEAFLRAEGVAAIHVLPSGNDWYQYPSTEAALAAVKTAVAGAGRVLAYGSSMGAYAAIRFADRAGANAVLALSPQYSADPAKMPKETRWPQEGRAIRWRAELDGPIACRVRPVVVYDGRGPDVPHIRRIARDTPIDPVRIPWGAHPVGTVLLETGMLQPLVRAALAGTLDPRAAEAELKERLPTAPTWWAERARRAPSWRRRAAVDFARTAVALAPDHALALHVLATSLDRIGRQAESLPLHARVAAITARDAGYLRPWGFALAAAGDRAAALSVAREIVDADPAVARSHQWLAWLLATTGDRAAALAAAEDAVTHDPANRAYRAMRDRIAAGRNVTRFHPQGRWR